jgi:hypothetical protein
MILDCLAVVRWHNKLQNPHSRPRSSVVADKHLSSVEQTDNSPNCVQVSSCWWGLEGYPGIWTSPPECLSIVKQSDGFPEVCCLVADRYKTADRTMMATQILCSHMKGSYLSACGLALIWMHAHSCSNPCRAYGKEEQENSSKPDCFASSAGLLQVLNVGLSRAQEDS